VKRIISIELVVFDMAGTTVRDDDAVNTCLRDALAAGEIAATRDEINEVMGMPKPTAIDLLIQRKLALRQPAPPRMVAAIHDDFLRRMISFYHTAPGVEPMPHAVETMHQFKEAGVKLALDTGFSRPIVQAILQRLGWDTDGFLDATVASDEVARGRPHPDLLQKAMQLTGVADAKAVVKVGDTPSYLLEGTAAGCGMVVGVTNGSHTRAQLEPYPHTDLIPTLAALPELVICRS
jgi:phosphonatase-like hydrolase